MISKSLEKASRWLSFRSLARGLLSFCIWWGHSSGVMSSTTASSSPDPGEATSQSDKWHCHLVPIGGVGVSDMVGRGVAGVGFPIAVASWGWSPKGQLGTYSQLATARGTWVPHELWGDRLVRLLHKPPEKIGNHTLLSLWPCTPKSCILSLRDCCKVWTWPSQVVSASLVVTAHIASASQILAVQWAFTSSMASAALASFWCRVVSVWDTNLLWQESMEALVVSSHPMATLISLCSQSTSSDRMPASALRWVLDCGVEGELAAVGSFWCRRWGGWVTDWNSSGDVLRHGHMLQCLWGSGQWFRCSWVCSLWAEWVFYSMGWCTQGCQWQLPPGGAVLGDRHWGCREGLLQPF